MIFVDTGYFLAVLNPRDRLFERAQRWSETIREPLITTQFVLVELLNSFSDPVDRPKAHAAVVDVLASKSWEVVEASAEWFLEGLATYNTRNDKSWSLTDCISFLVMQKRNLRQALAFDHHFEQAGYEALLRRDPT